MAALSYLVLGQARVVTSSWRAVMHSPTSTPIMSQSRRPITLATRGLTKCFDRPAVDALDLIVYGGEFYALVGPNGAGKTTTLRMVVGLLRPMPARSRSQVSMHWPIR